MLGPRRVVMDEVEAFPTMRRGQKGSLGRAGVLEDRDVQVVRRNLNVRYGPLRGKGTM